jgi:NADH-quinone oxidoreductase subunit L
VQNDIKRVIAYSTCSQLGYMFMAIGLSAYGAAMFHLFTHAFFKALLFLGAGSVIHALGGEQDLRRMGGMARIIPWTFALMMLGSLALAGMPPFAGYYSKDMILEAAFASHHPLSQLAYWIGTLGAFLTAFYSWRLLAMTFHGHNKSDHEAFHHAHESPPVMLVPLLVLGVGALVAGYVGYPYFVGEERSTFWGNSLLALPNHDPIEHAHHIPLWAKYLPLLGASLGIMLGYVFYVFKPGLPVSLGRLFAPLYQLFLHKWYVDELYEFLWVRPLRTMGRLFAGIVDKSLFDGVPNTAAAVGVLLNSRLKALQTGYVYHYVLLMLLCLILLLAVPLGVLWKL